MLVNRNKTIMCHVCGKVMRDDNLKRHLELKHGGSEFDGRQSQSTCTSSGPLDHTSQDDGEPVEKNEAKTPMDMLEFELERNYDAYKKNVEIGEVISLIISEKGIMEESLSKQHKFCLNGS